MLVTYTNGLISYNEEGYECGAHDLIRYAVTDKRSGERRVIEKPLHGKVSKGNPFELSAENPFGHLDVSYEVLYQRVPASVRFIATL